MHAVYHFTTLSCELKRLPAMGSAPRSNPEVLLSLVCGVYVFFELVV